VSLTAQVEVNVCLARGTHVEMCARAPGQKPPSRAV
jgi:hypothetical protein